VSRDEVGTCEPASDVGVITSGDIDVRDGPAWAIEDPLETLLEMARKGEIDPWNIDIISVTDRFLTHLKEVKKLNLRLSGRALLYASILLRMKSDVLLEPEEAVEEEGGPPWDPDASLPLHPRVLHPARRPATLYELIEELRRAEKVKEHRTLRHAERTRREQHRPSVKDAVAVAHDKLLREHAEALWDQLLELFDGREFVGFAELETEDGPVKTYLPLLYLAHWRRVRLEQCELFGELLIHPRRDAVRPAPGDSGVAEGDGGPTDVDGETG